MPKNFYSEPVKYCCDDAVTNNYYAVCICLTSVKHAKCGVRSTLCWKNGNISSSTELFGLKFVDSNLKLPNLSIHAFVVLQKSLEVH